MSVCLCVKWIKGIKVQNGRNILRFVAVCVCALFKFFVFTFFSCWFDLYINDIL